MEELPDAVRSAVEVSLRCGAAEVVSLDSAARRGRMSRTARLLVAGPEGTHRAVFAKWPSQRAKVRRIARYSGAYQREVAFYRELASRCDVRLPRVYFTEFHPESGEFVLLLEDLSAARAGDDLSSSVADVRHVLRSVARLHAQWVGDTQLDRMTWLPACDDPRVRRYVRFELDRIARAVARGRFGCGPTRAALPLLSTLGGRFADILGPAALDRQTLVHGDLHVDQVLFPHEGDGVIVDWQTVRRGTAGVDVARLIVLSLSVEERRRYEADLLDVYRAAVQECGALAHDRGALLDEYRCGILWTAFVNATFYLGSDGTEGEAAANTHEVMFDRIAAAAADHGLCRGRGWSAAGSPG